MKAQLNIISLVLIASFGIASHAGNSISKSNTRIDFNRMIDDNNSTRSELQKDIDVKANAAIASQETAAERAKVVDFVDVELGWGETAPLVDRRFNSIGEATVYKF